MSGVTARLGTLRYGTSVLSQRAHQVLILHRCGVLRLVRCRRKYGRLATVTRGDRDR